jgi:hypothetical protein
MHFRQVDSQPVATRRATPPDLQRQLLPVQDSRSQELRPQPQARAKSQLQAKQPALAKLQLPRLAMPMAQA